MALYSSWEMQPLGVVNLAVKGFSHDHDYAGREHRTILA